ncbi:hypothetical protein ACHAXA_007667 [Cyclostephanos tholiformis]|uniref:Uncharacterized protein n=1 Tax=Cyclostephanos tholiformis TaxID=382380 RepID=A0ABD3SDQ8_9STRA
MNNTFDFDFHMRRLAIESSDSIPHPPASLSESMMRFTSPEPQEFEYDCSRFVAMTPASSFDFSSERRMGGRGWGSSGLSRSRCVNNLSSLGNSFSYTSDSCVSSSRQVSSEPNAGWGYFVDTPSR